MDSLQRYSDSARERGVPEQAIELALRLARPQIELSSTNGGGGAAAGRYGGLPRLPREVAWDDGADFVASVDCAALPRDALDIPLPKDGHLLFFAHKTDPDGDGGGRVVHVPAGTATAERSPDQEDAPHTEPRPLHARTVWCLPTDGDDAVVADEETRRTYIGYGLQDRLDGGTAPDAELLLGGYAYSPQDPPIMGSSPDDEKGGWVLLAQAQYEMHDEPSFTGCPFWIIRRDDLESMNFAAAEVVMWHYH